MFSMRFKPNMHATLLKIKFNDFFIRMESGMKKRPLQAIARLFNKSQKKSDKNDGGKVKKSSSAKDITRKKKINETFF